MEWKPIETAPRDGTPIWAFAQSPLGSDGVITPQTASRHFGVIYWRRYTMTITVEETEEGLTRCEPYEKTFEYWERGPGLLAMPTHWMPLPKAPE